ncbi:addiction module antidote protein [Pseudomonas entomophila]|uniref:addiction module antidote protein n=1 Tax=Pseudomonas entomophila TaxID=312306 RepID=UPI003EC106A8
MPELLMPYDPAHAMTDPQAVAIFLTDALQTGDAGYLGKVLGMAVHAKGIGVIAEATGLTHDQLEGLFSAGDTLRLDALLLIVHALGVKLTVCPIDSDEPACSGEVPG